MSQELNSIISQLAEIDSASAKIMMQSQDEKTKYAELIHQKKQEYDESLEKQVDAEVLEYEATVKAEIEAEIAKSKADCDSTIEKLDAYYQDNKDSLVDEIVNRIIKE